MIGWLFAVMGWACFIGAVWMARDTRRRLADIMREQKVRAHILQDKDRDRHARLAEALEGPWRAEPVLDVDFYDDKGNAVAAAKADLSVSVNRAGLVIHGAAVATVQRKATLAAINVWFGDRPFLQPLTARSLEPGDMFRQRFGIPVDIDSLVPLSFKEPPQPFIRPVGPIRPGATIKNTNGAPVSVQPPPPRSQTAP